MRSKVSSTRKFDLITGVHGGDNERRMNGTRRHSCNHKRWFADKSRKLCRDVNTIFSLQLAHVNKWEYNLDETRTVLFDPIDIIANTTFTTFKNLTLSTNSSTPLQRPRNNDSHTRPIFIPMRKTSQSRNPTRTKIKNMSRTRKHRSLFPMYRKMCN